MLAHKGEGWELHCGDALAVLRETESETIQTCITSPPYYSLRDYGVAGQIGLEASVGEYVGRLVETFREVKRVLHPSGVTFLNLGDSYGSGEVGRHDLGEYTSGGVGVSDRVPLANGHKHHGRKRQQRPRAGNKQLLGVPWRVAFALQADGWVLRSAMPWLKGNALPESVRDRPTTAHEYVFILAKGPKYFYDREAVKVPAAGAGRMAKFSTPYKAARAIGRQPSGNERPGAPAWQVPAGRNRRTTDGWRDSLDLRIAFQEEYLEHLRQVRDKGGLLEDEGGGPLALWVNPRPFRGCHFAVMPERLVEPCVLAGSRPGDLILDPFAGSGTVGAVALKHGRRFLGIDLNRDYLDLARNRILEATEKLHAVA